MAQYTDFFEDMSYNIFEENDYIEELKKAVNLFRTFDNALDVFIKEHGYEGDLSNVDEKVSFISDKLKQIGAPVPRKIRNWYLEHSTIERKTAFLLCFAFELQVEEVNDFLKRICLTRGFDFHCVEDIVYFFGFKKRLSYVQVKDILKQVEVIKPENTIGEDVVYTDLIAEEISDIETVEELVNYLNENTDKFGYNSATAYEVINDIWKSIVREEGIAAKEKKQLYVAFDKEVTGQPVFEGVDKKRKERKRMDDSIWEIYLQILGLSGNYVGGIYKERSLKSILNNNGLMHPLAQESFPDRDGLNKILNGVHVSYERVRKQLILLLFYKFWVNKALSNNNYEAGYGDCDRFIATMNNVLVDAGYQVLYPGNPYDFIIMMSANSECPMMTFREYMKEMFFNKVDVEGIFIAGE